MRRYHSDPQDLEDHFRRTAEPPPAMLRDWTDEEREQREAAEEEVENARN